MDEIFLLQSDPRASATLVRALDPPHSVRTVKGFLSLSALLRNRQPLACVLDVFDSPWIHSDACAGTTPPWRWSSHPTSAAGR